MAPAPAGGSSAHPPLATDALERTVGVTTELKSEREVMKVKGNEVIEKVKQLIHEGNVRRIIIKHGEHTVVELPVTIGVVAAVLAPMLAAVGAIAAVVTDCTIEVERTDTPEQPR